MFNVLRCQLTYSNIALRPRKPEGSLGRTAQDGHLDSHTAPEICDLPVLNFYLIYLLILSSGVCWLVAVVLFAVEFDDTYDTFNYDEPALGYSFALGVISAVLQLVAGIMLLLIKPRDAAPAAAETS